ncbi:MAG: hypothetical protein ACMXYM_05710 [Candidatus Woesearchaeota archaeon]
MELATTEETEQPVFGRTRLILNATFEASVPSRGVIAQRICEARGVAPELVVIRTITSRFGGGHATIEAYVYEDAKQLARIEAEHLVERTKKTMAQAPEAEPQAEPEPVEEASEATEESSSDEK